MRFKVGSTWAAVKWPSLENLGLLKYSRFRTLLTVGQRQLKTGQRNKLKEIFPLRLHLRSLASQRSVRNEFFT
jgi:hypothetical protein